MKKRHLLLLVSVLVAVLTGCSSSTGKVAANYEVKSTDMEFGPKRITIKKGETARFVLTNAGAVEHDFTVDKIKGKAKVVEETGSHAKGHSGASVHVSAAPGKSGALDFTPSESGTYEFYCTVSGHKDAGMKGTLVVE